MRNIFYEFVCNVPFDVTDDHKHAIWGNESTMFFRVAIDVFELEVPSLI